MKNNLSPVSESPIKLFDTHAHLDDPGFDDDLEGVLQRARSAGLIAILTVGTSLKTSHRAVELSQKHEFVYAAVGVHPHEAANMGENDIDDLASLARQGKVVAVGEIGLDFYRNHSPRATQLEKFRQQLELAAALNLPVLVHDRNAHLETMAVLRELTPKRGGILHCFSAEAKMAADVIRLGFYISFAGNLTYANAVSLKQEAGLIPIDRTLIETDCPYLTPVPHRGKRNEPAYVSQVAETLAELHRLSLEDVARITTRNAVNLFELDRFKPGARIAYKIRNSLYLNITNECTLSCVFCAKQRSYTVKGHFLKLEKEPSSSELLQAVGDSTRFTEVVFCGFGEPLLRLDTLLEVARTLKKMGARIRIDTDGLANLIHGRNILPELAGLIDSISVSLNAENAAKYARICPSSYCEAAYQAVKDFIREAKAYIPEVTATAVTLPSIDIEACRHIAEQELGVKFRVRTYNEVG